MKVQKSKLLEILDSLRPGLSNDEIIDNSDAICFVDDQIYTYNDRVWVLFPFESDFEGTVKEDRLYKHLKKAGADKDGNIGLEQKKGELIVSSGKKGKTKAGIPMLELADSQLFSTDQEWKKLPKGFAKAMRMAAMYASTNFNKPKLTCVHVSGKQIEASDGQRGFRFSLPKKIKDSFLIPSEPIAAFGSNEYIKYALDRETNWAFFKTKEGLITALRMPGESDYPDMDFLFEFDGDPGIDFPKELTKVIDKAVDFIGQEEDTAYLHLKFDGKKILVSSQSTHGWFRDPVKHKSDVEVSFYINPHFLKEILRTTVTSKMNESRGMLLFESEDWELVINISLD